MEPVVLRPDEGETTSDRRERTVRIKADLEQVAITESRYAAGERGPGPHIHVRHTDAFYVRDGTLTFEVGSERVVAGAGACVAVPPGVVHTFRNEGPTEARFLNIHAPGERFGEYLRAMRDGREEDAARFDSEDPPPDGGRPASDAWVSADGADTVMLAGNSVAFKAEADVTDGTFGLVEYTAAARSPGPPLHVHGTLVDVYYVLDGTLTVELGDETHTAPPGSFVLVPPGAEHTFSNGETAPARFLNLHAPGGFERYFREAAEAIRDGSPDPQRLAAIAEQYDFRAVVQPY